MTTRAEVEPLTPWVLAALDLAVSFGHLQSVAEGQRGPGPILAAARDHLRPLLAFGALAFLLVGDEGPEFVMADCDPAADRAWLQAEVEAHAAAGAVAWALRCNRPVVVPARAGAGHLVLHALTAGARTLGLFAGALPDGAAAPDEAAANLLSLILITTAQALASARTHRDLERMVADRTRALQAAHDELTRAQAQAAHTAKMEAVGRLAAGIAHDFNNLLQVIQGHGELLAARLPVGDPLARSVEPIAQAARRATDLTRRLLVFSSRQDLHPRVLDLNALLQDISGLLRRLIGEHIAIDTTCQPALGAVEADPAQLERVVMNLAVNARDAMPRGGRLTLATAGVDLAEEEAGCLGLPAGPYVQLTVADTGCGMDAATQARAFEPFFTTKAPGRGTGLGLATVYGIVRQCGGAITLQSAPGRGTRFVISLPRLDRRPAPAPAPDRRPAARGSETILLAEDDDAVRTLARDVLETHGYQVIEARDGSEALGVGHARREPIDLLLTDIVMPGLSGQAVAERLAAERPGLAVVYMSGYPEAGGPGPALPLLRKPFTTAGLTHRVRQALDGARAAAAPGA